MTALGAVSRLVSDRVMSRLLAVDRSFDPDDLPRRLPLDERARYRLVIGAENAAGQGHAWAAAMSDCIPGASAASFAVDRGSPFRHAVDRSIPAPVFTWSRDWQRAHREQLLTQATHLVIEGGRPVLAGGLRGDVVADSRLLRRHGVSVAYVWHGSDVRDPDAHAARFADSPYREGLWEATPVLRQRAKRSRALLRKAPAPSLVSTPDLLRDLPEATWLPVVVEPHRWKASRAPFAHEGLPVVVHAPSRSVVKGSDLIDPVLEKLATSGLIEYRRLTGVVHSQMPAAYAAADIVVDQVRLGAYGVLATEAMAAGRIVLGDPADDVFDTVNETTGRQLPISVTSAGRLEQSIREICADPAEAVSRAAQGPEFVRDVHDGRLSARILATTLGMATGSGRVVS